MQTNDYGQLIDKLADKLAVPAAKLWGILVVQARIEAYWAAFWTVACAAIVLALGLNLRRIWKIEQDDTHYDTPPWFLLSCVTAGIAFVALLINGYQATVGLLNPDYVALSKILDSVK